MTEKNNITDEYVTAFNVLNLSFRNLLSMYQLREHDDIVKIFRKGGIDTDISKSKVKSWKTDPEKTDRGTPMPIGLFYAFTRGLQQSKIDGDF